MKERPIIFSGSMVQAILAGRKTQTRRVVKFNEPFSHADWPTVYRTADGGWGWTSAGQPLGVMLRRPGKVCPYGQPGDRLWVRETWKHHFFGGPAGICAPGIMYKADGEMLWKTGASDITDKIWRSPIHMPRWASRIALEITDVRVERVQEIKNWDAEAEGCNKFNDKCTWCHGSGMVSSSIDIRQSECPCEHEDGALDNFQRLWEDIHGPGAWQLNPWVWAITFRRVTK